MTASERDEAGGGQPHRRGGDGHHQQGGQRDRGAGLRPVLLRHAGQEQERGPGEQLQGDIPSVQQG